MPGPAATTRCRPYDYERYPTLALEMAVEDLPPEEEREVVEIADQLIDEWMEATRALRVSEDRIWEALGTSRAPRRRSRS